MTEFDISHYWMAITAAVVLLASALVLRAAIIKNHKWSHSISAHIGLIALFGGLVFTARVMVIQLLADYKLTFITEGTVNIIALCAMMFLVGQQLFQLINRLTRKQILRGSDPTSARMISRIMKSAIVMLILLLFGEHFGIGPSGLLAFGGVGGIALGIAGRDVLSNLFSGVMLYFDRPFSIGDWISSPDRDIEGTVVEIGWRLTQLKTFDNRPLYVPNSLFSTISVENPGRMTNRRISTTIGLRYEDAGKVTAIVAAIRDLLEKKPEIDQTQSLLIYFDGFGASSLTIMVYCFTKTTRWAEWLAIQQDVFMAIVDIVHAHGADFAFPSRTLYFENKTAVDSPAGQARPVL